MMWRRMPKSLMAVRNALFEWMGSQCFGLQRAASSGLRRPRPAGMPMHACGSFLRSCLMSFLGAFFHQHTSVRNSAWMRSCLSVGKVMQWLMPSKTQPRISLCVSQSPSPWHSFLKATGPLPCHQLLMAVGKQSGCHAGWCVTSVVVG